MDIRFSLDGPPTTGPFYWAFAGTSKTEFPNFTGKQQQGDRSRAGGNGGNLVTFPSAECTWTRCVDSRGDLETTDQGTCFLLHGGDVLEVGTMRDGKGGEVMYQELWGQVTQADVEGLLGEATRSVDEESLKALEQGREVVTVVALLKGRGPYAETVLGVVIRVGPFCQGIVSLPRGGLGEKLVCVDRWGLDQDGAWYRDPRGSYDDEARGHEVELPCEWVRDEKSTGGREVGDEMQCTDGKWVVVEASYPPSLG